MEAIVDFPKDVFSHSATKVFTNITTSANSLVGKFPNEQTEHLPFSSILVWVGFCKSLHVLPEWIGN